jgi:hypothetical protein
MMLKKAKLTNYKAQIAELRVVAKFCSFKTNIFRKLGNKFKEVINMPWSEAFESDCEETKYFLRARKELIGKGVISANSNDDGGHRFGDGTTARELTIMKEAIKLKNRS